MLQLTTNAFEEKHLQNLSNRLTGFSNATVLQVFQHLYQMCSSISKLDLLVSKIK